MAFIPIHKGSGKKDATKAHVQGCKVFCVTVFLIKLQGTGIQALRSYMKKATILNVDKYLVQLGDDTKEDVFLCSKTKVRIAYEMSEVKNPTYLYEGIINLFII